MLSLPFMATPTGHINNDVLAENHQLAIRSGAVVDAIGANSQNMIGGSGGSLSTIDTSKVRAIDVTYGKNKYTWKYGVLEMSLLSITAQKSLWGQKILRLLI